jgi:hypothetical protein
MVGWKLIVRWTMDDEKIKKSNLQDTLCQAAYILVYVKIDDEEIHHKEPFHNI